MADDGKAAYRNSDIQGDILPGFRSRTDATFFQRFLMMRIGGGADDARNGLEGLLAANVISSGRDIAGEGPGDGPPAYVNVAFTARGLEQMGRPGTDPAFLQGLAERSVANRLLGDPEGWRIGGHDAVVDVVFNIGAAEEDRVNRTTDLVLRTLGPAYAELARFDGRLLPEGREHFGFRDGLAQPFAAEDPSAGQEVAGGDVAGSDVPGDDPRSVDSTALWPNWDTVALQAAAAQAEIRVTEAEQEFKAASVAMETVTDEGARAANRRLQAAKNAVRRTTAEAGKASRKAAAAAAVNRVEQRSPGVPIRPIKQFVVRDGDEFTNNGSYMVWLQLEQHPGVF